MLYPIAAEDAGKLPVGWTRATTRARGTGEVRPPKRGEWYLSGAIVEAYRAFTDLPHSAEIARLVQGRMVFDSDDRCGTCGEHIADPHAPGCPNG